jgi:MoaA/NifB/PqqE/SkfB family radical SAM enzyme
LTTSEQTALKDIRAELSNTTDNDLEGFWEIKIKMTTPNTELIDAIYDELRAAGDQLLSLIPTFTEDEKSSQESLNINELNINQLFELYYREKFPDMETLPPEIVDEFNSLLEDLNHGENP